MGNKHFRDYTFEEWKALSYEIKRDIWNHYWDPFHPNIGKATRKIIINEFKKAYPEITAQTLEIGYGYFSWYVGCLYVIVPYSKIKVPKEFASIKINKGTRIRKVDKKTIIVNWRDIGGKNAEFRLYKNK